VELGGTLARARPRGNRPPRVPHDARLGRDNHHVADEKPRVERLRGAIRALDKSECLSHVVPLGERHLRSLVSEFVEHYHIERTHQGLANELVVQRSATANDNGRVKRRKRIGGMLNYY
jgi:hypothetical protein